MEPNKEHIFNRFEDRNNTCIEKNILFNGYSVSLEEDFDIIEDTRYVDDLQGRNFFLEGVVEQLKRLGKKYEVSDTEGILIEVKNRFIDILGIECPKSVKNWIKTGNVNRTRKYRYNNYDFCLALEMDINTTREFFLKNFLISPFNYKDSVDAVYFYCMWHKKGIKTIKAMIEEADKFQTLNSDVTQTEGIGRTIIDIDGDNEFMEYLRTHCYDEKFQFQTARGKIINLIEENKQLAGVSSNNALLDEIYGYRGQIQYKDTHKGISKSNLPALFTESFPKHVEISKIVNGTEVTYEVLRKALVIMEFYNYYRAKENKPVDGDKENLMIMGDLREFYDEVNGSMAECGFVQLYLRHPFDSLILFCAKSAYPIVTFKNLIDKQYLEMNDDLL